MELYREGKNSEYLLKSLKESLDSLFSFQKKTMHIVV